MISHLVLVLFVVFISFGAYSEEPASSDNPQVSQELQKEIEAQKSRELEIQKNLRKKQQALEKKNKEQEEKLKKTFSSNYKRLSVDNNIFWPSPKWINSTKTITFNLDITKIKPDNPSQKIKISILNVNSKDSQSILLSHVSSSKYAGSFNFSQLPGEEFYLFYTFFKKGKEKTIYYKLTNSQAAYEEDIIQVNKTDTMLSILITVRKQMEEKRQLEEKNRIKKELDELKRAKAEIENLEKKLKSEQELLLKKRLEEERITQLKEAEKQRQLYEQRLAEERKRRLEEDKARVIAERNRQIEEMKRKKASEIAESNKLVSLGQEEIINGEYDKAITLFKKANSLNPLNTDADFYMGVALFYLDNREAALKILLKIEEENPTYVEVHYYIASLYFKNQKYGAAVVKFKDSIKYNVKPEDSNFFLAMSYYKMEDYKEAIKYFDLISKKDGIHKENAYLFVGLCYFKTKKYAESIKIFENLYYESDDSIVANQAEQFLKKARAMKRFEDRKAKIFGADISIGASQSSNVPSTSTSAETPEGGNSSLGYNASLSLAYLPYYNETWDSSLSLNFNNLSYSNENHAAYETQAMGASAMIKYKSIYKIFNPQDEEQSKNYVYAFSLILDYTQTNMDFDGSGKKSTYSKAKTISPSLMVILSDFHIGTISLPLGMDDNYSTDDKDARFYGLNYSHIYFLDESKTKNISSNLGVNMNMAAGDNESYTQLSMGAFHTRPLYEKISATGGASLALQSYGSHVEKRSDKNINLSLSCSRDIYKDAISSYLSFTYTKNSSNLETNTYSGWVAEIKLTGTY